MPHHTAQIILSFCFSFHMPLFFIFSRYFMYPEGKFRWMTEARQLLFTYVVTALCVLAGVTCMAMLGHRSRLIALRQWDMAAIYGSGDISNLTLWRVDLRIGAIWFLFALFWAHLLLHCLARLPYTLVWMVLCSAIWLCLLAVRAVIVEHPSWNVRGCVSLCGVSCQEI